MAGDAPRAEALLRVSFDRLDEMGDAGFRMTVAGMLSRALYAQGKLEEAKWFAELCRREVQEDDFTGIGSGARALVAAAEGDDVTALRLAEEALARISLSDFLRDHGDRLVELAQVHTLAGRRSEALAALDRADELYMRKGCVAALAATAARRAAFSD